MTREQLKNTAKFNLFNKNKKEELEQFKVFLESLPDEITDTEWVYDDNGIQFLYASFGDVEELCENYFDMEFGELNENGWQQDISKEAKFKNIVIVLHAVGYYSEMEVYFDNVCK